MRTRKCDKKEACSNQQEAQKTCQQRIQNPHVQQRLFTPNRVNKLLAHFTNPETERLQKCSKHSLQLKSGNWSANSASEAETAIRNKCRADMKHREMQTDYRDWTETTESISSTGNVL